MKAMALALALTLTGCGTLERVGRTGATVGGFLLPEYAASFDNVLALLQDEAIFTDVSFVARTPDGRRWGLDEIQVVPVVAEHEGYPLTQLPPGWVRRISKQPLPPEAEEQRRILADALRQIPSTPTEDEQ